MSHHLPLTISTSEEHYPITTRLLSKNQLLQMQLDEHDKELNRNSFFVKSPQNSSLLVETILISTFSNEKIKVFEKIIEQKLSQDNTEKKFDNKMTSRDKGLERIQQKFKNFRPNVERSFSSSRDSSRKSIKSFNFELPIKESRRPTLESIKNAINNFPDDHIKLVNVDSIEGRYIGNFSSNSVGILNPHVPERSIEKRDLQTQTSLLLEKLLSLPPN